MRNENEVGNLGTNDEIYFQNMTSFSTRSFTFDVANSSGVIKHKKCFDGLLGNSAPIICLQSTYM